MPITTTASLTELLEQEGYAPEVSGDSVLIAIGGTGAPYTAAFTFNPEHHLQITCQLALLGDIPEEQLPAVAVAALDANMQISPFAFAVIGAGEGEVDVKKCPIVLIDTVLTSDLSEAEVRFALDRLLQALTYSRDILKLGLTPAAA
jgi:hypothetical protein